MHFIIIKIVKILQTSEELVKYVICAKSMTVFE